MEACRLQIYTHTCLWPHIHCGHVSSCIFYKKALIVKHIILISLHTEEEFSNNLLKKLLFMNYIVRYLLSLLNLYIETSIGKILQINNHLKKLEEQKNGEYYEKVGMLCSTSHFA